MSSLYRRSKSPYWWVKFKDRFDRTQWKSTGIPLNNRPEALKFQADLDRSVELGKDVVMPHLIMDSVKAFMATNKSRNLAQSTLKNYTNILRKFLEFFLENYPGKRYLQDISPRAVQSFMNSLDLSPATSRLYLATLRRWFNYCLKMEHIEKNPADIIDAPKVDTKNIPIWSPREVNRILMAAEVFEERLLYEILYRMAGRITETLKLEVKDVDTVDWTITFRAENNKARRDDVMEIPEKLKHLIELRLKCSDLGYLVFRGPEGKSYYRSCFKKLLKKLELEGGFHKFRHSACTHWIAEGVHLKVVQHLMRHRSINTTMKYVHLLQMSKTAISGQVNRLPI